MSGAVFVVCQVQWTNADCRIQPPAPLLHAAFALFARSCPAGGAIIGGILVDRWGLQRTFMATIACAALAIALLAVRGAMERMGGPRGRASSSGYALVAVNEEDESDMSDAGNKGDQDNRETE